MRIGMSEILVILLAALILFGPNRLPEMGKALGKAIREFRNATSDLGRELEQVREEVTRAAAPAAEPPAEAATERTSPGADACETTQEEGDGRPKPQSPQDETPHGYHSA